MAKGAAAETENDDQGVAFEDAESFTFDLTSVDEDAGFAPLPKGMYSVVISKVEYKLSKASGNPMWNIVYDVNEGEFADKNRKIFDIVSLKTEQMGRVKRFLNRVAPELITPGFNPKKIAEEQTLVGKNLRVKVDIESDPQYGDRNRVKDHLAVGAGGAGGSDGGFNM